MNRLASRLGVRALSISLLAAGLAGGVYLGQDRDDKQQSEVAQVAVQANLDEALLLKRRQAEHAAARAWRSQAESAAARKAAAEAKAAATKARVLEQKAIAAKKAEEAEKERKAAEEQESGADVPYTGPVPASCNEYTGNRKTGCALMLQAGFKIDQFPCLDKLWKKESGWNHRAKNPSSGAYGIPQSLPGSKMASVADDWKTNPATQIKWGLGYIEGRYGTPCGAWGHSQAEGWY